MIEPGEAVCGVTGGGGNRAGNRIFNGVGLAGGAAVGAGVSLDMGVASVLGSCREPTLLQSGRLSSGPQHCRIVLWNSTFC